jgi:hypothetical protein
LSVLGGIPWKNRIPPDPKLENSVEEIKIMDENEDAREEKQPESAVKSKKVYHKPAFRFEKVFERDALSCGKVAATQATCRGFGIKSS